MASAGYSTALGQTIQPVQTAPGASGYFSAPAVSLDPSLFEGESIRADVRNWILATLYNFWEGKYEKALEWSEAWIAGSGISYQWAADRGNGDLDVLVGIDWGEFFRFNDRFSGLSGNDMASIINREFKDQLWPRTAQTSLHGRTFEVTFYVNPQSADIRDINPYAAYSLTKDEWTVKPPKVGPDPAKEFPTQYWAHVNSEKNHARDLVSRYNRLVAEASGMQAGSPGWHNTMRQLEVVVAQANTLFDDIHLGRRQAFSAGGSGYGDYYNFRWQAHKQAGTVQALHAVSQAHHTARETADTEQYGQPVDAADVALRRAALWNRGLNGRV